MIESISKELERDPDSRTLLDVLEKLSGTPKRLPCKLFYDHEGSRLFERITALPSYYLTRSETSILARYAAEIAEEVGPGAVLVEFGSGGSDKAALLLDRLVEPRAYVPIDISREVLLASADAWERRYPTLAVHPIVGDFTEELALPLAHGEFDGPTTAFFPGSTIGNFEPDEAVSFLRRVRRSSAGGTRLLIGVDLPKDPAVMERAYDDPEGVTALFNLNALAVLNRRYGAHFRRADFVHRAVWNEAESRMEMHLVCQRDHTSLVGPHKFRFRAGEPIVSEHCYKYTLDAFRSLAEGAGYVVRSAWLDERQLFSVQLLVPATA